MSNSIYRINKGINKSIEFKGFKAQYIWYMGGLMLALLLIFAILYFLGINQYLSLAIIGGLALFGTQKIYVLSKKYGQHGLMKAMSRKMIPPVLTCRDRLAFKKRGKLYKRK